MLLLPGRMPSGVTPVGSGKAVQRFGGRSDAAKMYCMSASHEPLKGRLKVGASAGGCVRT